MPAPVNSIEHSCSPQDIERALLKSLTRSLYETLFQGMLKTNDHPGGAGTVLRFGLACSALYSFDPDTSAMASISTSPPRGSPATAKHERAGGFLVKNLR